MRECGWIGESGSMSVFDRETGTVLGRLALGFLIARWTYVGLMMVQRTKTEDMMLRREFGAEWDLWASRVRYRLIPGVF